VREVRRSAIERATGKSSHQKPMIIASFIHCTVSLTNQTDVPLTVSELLLNNPKNLDCWTTLRDALFASVPVFIAFSNVVYAIFNFFFLFHLLFSSAGWLAGLARRMKLFLFATFCSPNMKRFILGVQFSSR